MGNGSGSGFNLGSRSISQAVSYPSHPSQPPVKGKSKVKGRESIELLFPSFERWSNWRRKGKISPTAGVHICGMPSNIRGGPAQMEYRARLLLSDGVG